MFPLAPRSVSFVVFVHPIREDFTRTEIESHVLRDASEWRPAFLAAQHRILVHAVYDLQARVVSNVFATSVYVGWHYVISLNAFQQLLPPSILRGVAITGRWTVWVM